MKPEHVTRGFNRREFLITAAAIPALSGLRAAPAFTETSRHQPPYLALEKFILPGNDEFPEEKIAMQIRESLNSALRSRELPVGANFKGFSPCPKSYRDLAPDLKQAVFETSDAAVADGWRRWVKSLGNVRRAQFYPLPDGIVRYEIASHRDEMLFYHVGRWKQTWDAGRLVEFSPIEEHVALSGKPYFSDVTASVFENVPSFREQLVRGVPYW